MRQIKERKQGEAIKPLQAAIKRTINPPNLIMHGKQYKELKDDQAWRNQMSAKLLQTLEPDYKASKLQAAIRAKLAKPKLAERKAEKQKTADMINDITNVFNEDRARLKPTEPSESVTPQKLQKKLKANIRVKSLIQVADPSMYMKQIESTLENATENQRLQNKKNKPLNDAANKIKDLIKGKLVREAAYKSAKQKEMIKATARSRLKTNDKVFSTSSVDMAKLAKWRRGEGPPPKLVDAIQAQKARERESIKKEAKALGGAYAASGKMRP